ncbi:hypothetical protein [Devosia sp.]|uniref:hypothetical protein n=1 Tax=Devosia sp. TaxID=1871048 RepID=UPI003A8CBE69
MNIPQWVKPGLMGAAVGAIAISIFGFGFSGWMTGGSATELANETAETAVVDALTPYCLNRATAPGSAATMAEFNEATSYARRGVVEKAGWATPMGADSPNRALAQACQLELAALN